MDKNSRDNDNAIGEENKWTNVTIMVWERNNIENAFSKTAWILCVKPEVRGSVQVMLRWIDRNYIEIIITKLNAHDGGAEMYVIIDTFLIEYKHFDNTTGP